MIRVERIQADIAAIAAITQTPGRGATRPTFSAEWGQARDYVVAQAEAAGCVVRIDAAGNVFAKASTLDANARTWLCGSHVDTVPSGGDYDGVAGVVVALELLRSAHEDGLPLPIELVIFAEEEGPTFGLGMIGSRILSGELSAESIAGLRNAAGQNYLEAGVAFGVDAARFAEAKLDTGKHRGLIELHIEQGPGMWQRDQRLAVVRAIAGRRQMQVSIGGEANHAGATSMQDRRDALAAAAECVGELERYANEIGGGAVCTVGRLLVHPNAVNVIPDRVNFTIDFRSGDTAAVERSLGDIRAKLGAIAARRGVTLKLDGSESIAARPMDESLVGKLSRLGGNLPVTVSGALHDSAVLAPLLPTVMLFVPSRGGISHNAEEFSRVEDVAAGASLIEKFLRLPSPADLSDMTSESFVTTLGGVYEHSPWVAERTWQRRPFATVEQVIDTMADVVKTAGRGEHVTLIRKHPDLVGKLAQENKLTRESTGEQHAAGLTALSADEVKAFERYNTAYRARFGFPFIICARENKKDAILAAFPKRLQNSHDAEVATALAEIDKIARLRIKDAIADE